MDADDSDSTPVGFLFDTGTPREYHECESNQQEALLILRHRKLTKVSFEKDRPGTRLAPSIDILRNGWGFEILGDGSSTNPYWMPNANASPTMVRTTQTIQDAYYESDHWCAIRQQRWQFDNHRCVLCVDSCRDELQCHHIIYNLFSENLDELMTVCRHHHKLIHDRDRGGCFLKFPTGVETLMAERLLGLVAYPFKDWLLP
jgi:hypothetical protein